MCRLCTYKEAPEWSVHNKYIHTGYRTGFGWRAAVRSVRVPPNPAPALSLSSVRRASTSPSRVSPSPRVFGVASSAPDVPTSPARALASAPLAPPLTLVRAPSPPRAQVLMVHNETANIWTHLVGLAIFVAITVTMATGWGAHHMPALPDTWVTGANATRAALVARTVRFRLGVEGSRAALSDLATRLRDGSHLFEWTHPNPNPKHGHGARDEDEDDDRRAPNVGAPPLERDASDAEGWNGDESSPSSSSPSSSSPSSSSPSSSSPSSSSPSSSSPSSSSSSEAFHARVALDGATDALLAVAHKLLHHLHAPDAALLPHTRGALLSAVSEARGAARLVASAVESAAGRVEDAARHAARDAADAIDRHAESLASVLETAPETPEMPPSKAPRWPMYVFLGGAIVCLSFSATCHTLACVGARVSAIVWRIDYVGIAALIVASFYPVVYYSFMCVPGLRAMYLSVMSAFGAAVLVITLMDRFQAPQYSPLRAALFSGLGGCGSFPILHQTWFTWHTVPTPIAVMLWMELLMGACYLSGAVIYARAVPEKWKPGRFDIVASSHNIFHVLVVMGAYVHYRAALVLMAWRDHHGCDADVQLLRSWYVDGGWVGKIAPWAFVGAGGGGGEL